MHGPSLTPKSPVSPRLSSHRVKPALGPGLAPPVSPRDGSSTDKPKPLPRPGAQRLPIKPASVRPDPDLTQVPLPPLPLSPPVSEPASPAPLPAWAKEAGLGAAETQALQRAGFTEDRMADWPLPDMTARSWLPRPAAPASGRPTPLGMTEVSRQVAPGQVEHLWFMPITNDRELRRLRQGLFLMALARELGIPGAAPPVQAGFEPTARGLTYGMLVPFDPASMPALDAGLNPEQPDLIGQCVALDWLSYLIGQSIDPADLVWTQPGNDRHLRPRLPLAAPLPSVMNTGSGPARPDVIDRAMLSRLQQIDLGAWKQHATEALGSLAGCELADRLEQARAADSRFVVVKEPSQGWNCPTVQQSLGSEDSREALERVRAGKTTPEQARHDRRHDGLAVRIPLEHGLAQIQQVGSPRGSSRPAPLKVPRPKTLGKGRKPHDGTSAALRKTLVLGEPVPSSPRGTLSPRQPVSEDPSFLHSRKIHEALKPYQQALCQRQEKGAVMLTARSLNLALVKLLDQAEASAEELGTALEPGLSQLRYQIKAQTVLIEKAMSLSNALVIQNTPVPLGAWTPQLRMDLVSAGAHVDTVAPALHCGATGEEILKAHQLALPPSWPLLGQALLQEAARLHNTTAQALRSEVGWAELAAAMHQARDQQAMSPRSSRIGTRRQPAQQVAEPTFQQTLTLNTSRLWVDGRQLPEAVKAARAFDAAYTLLSTTDLRDAGLLAVRRNTATQALQELRKCLQVLSQALVASASPEGPSIVSDLEKRLIGHEAQIATAQAHAQSIGRRLPPKLPRTPSVGDLLRLTGPDGPDLDYVVHGLLVGWESHDILAAHAAKWSPWVMEWGSTFSDAQTREDLAQASARSILKTIGKPK